MLQSSTSKESSEPLFTLPHVEDELFEQNIDDFDEKMDNEYDDGIAQSSIEDLYDGDAEDDEGDDEDNIIPCDADDEGTDYDELEDD